MPNDMENELPQRLHLQWLKPVEIFFKLRLHCGGSGILEAVSKWWREEGREIHASALW